MRRIFLASFVLLVALAGCGKKEGEQAKFTIEGKKLGAEDARNRVASLLSGNLADQEKGVEILKAAPQLIEPNVAQLLKIARLPIDYSYAFELSKAENNGLPSQYDPADPRVVELEHKCDLRNAALDLALQVDSKEALELATQYASSGIPGEATMGKELLRKRRFQKSLEETHLPPAWIGGRQLPATEFAEKVKTLLESKDPAQREIALNAFRFGMGGDMKFPNTAPYVQYFHKTEAQSESDAGIRQARLTIVSLMGYSQNPEAKPFLEAATEDKDPEVEAEAFQALSTYQDRQSSQSNSSK